MPSGRHAGSILLADISGYSSFLNDVQIAHEHDAFADGQVPAAYAMMSSFLEGIASSVEPPFTVLKFEGDAAFAVATDGVSPRGEAMIDCVRHCYDDFSERWLHSEDVWTCTCDTCSRKDTLDLKFILHYGEFFIQAVGGQVEAVGPEVNVAHKLLKNSASEVVGTRGYALFTEETVDALDLPLSDAAQITETVGGERRVNARVIPLHV